MIKWSIIAFLAGFSVVGFVQPLMVKVKAYQVNKQVRAEIQAIPTFEEWLRTQR